MGQTSNSGHLAFTGSPNTGQSLASVERPGSRWRTCSAMREACPLSLPSLIYRTGNYYGVSRKWKDSSFQQTASQRTYGTTVWRKSSRKSCHTGPKTAGENTTQSQEVLSFSLKGLIFLTWHFLAVILKIEKVPWSRSCFAELIPKAGPLDNFWGQWLTMAWAMFYEIIIVIITIYVK